MKLQIFQGYIFIGLQIIGISQQYLVGLSIPVQDVCKITIADRKLICDKFIKIKWPNRPILQSQFHDYNVTILVNY